MPHPPKNRIPKSLQPSPWIIVGSVVILLITVIVLAVQNYKREEHYIARILGEKGAALIKTVEAGARTGMKRMMWGGDQVQYLIEEAAVAQDVLYITIYDEDGRVLAASDKTRIGTLAPDHPEPAAADPPGTTQWQVVDTADGHRSFEVFKRFRPLNGRGPWHRGRRERGGRHHGMMGAGRDHDAPIPGIDRQTIPVIVVGLDPAPYESARYTDIRNTVIISGVLVILGFAGFISMYWMQSYRITRKRLQDTSAIAEEVMTSLPVGLIATDDSGRIAFFNSAAERITGLNLSAARGKPPRTILPDEVCELSTELDRGDTVFEREMTCEFVKNRLVPVSVSASRIINEEGHFVGQVLILRDLGEIRKLQETLRRQEKLAAIGGLAAGVAHEIRNPLSSIKGIASYFKKKFSHVSEDKEAAEVMIQEVDRLNRVISELLDFVRPTDLHVKEADMNGIIEHAIRLIRTEAAAQEIEIQLDLAPAPLTAQVDADRFSQCFLNLYLNALQAMAPGGRLKVTSARLEDQSIKIDIADNGRGIEPGNLEKIFNPYFTTKASGTGLGLTIVNKIIEAHNGQLKVHSTEGKGTVFSILLPGPETGLYGYA